MDLKVIDLQYCKAILRVLSEYYDLTKSDDIGALLNSMSILNDGKPADA